VATPHTTTIEDLANFLNVPKAKTAKAVFLMATIPQGKEVVERFVFAVVRGDMEVNETKLANAVSAQDLRPATEAEILAVGAVPGYASPVGLKGALVVVDDAVTTSPNLVAGANEDGYHLLNVNYGRDYSAEIFTDIAAAQEGDGCPNCGGAMRSVRGVEVGNIFKLGTRYSDSMGCKYLDKNGEEKPVIMGSYGIGSGRLLACVAEEHHDDYGLIWPINVAPYEVHLVALGGKDGSQVQMAADELYDALKAAGVEVLYDDRDESPGVKFNDADLIGLPVRLTVSSRGLGQDSVEFKRRDSQEKSMVPRSQAVERVVQEIAGLKAALQEKVVRVPYDE